MNVNDWTFSLRNPDSIHILDNSGNIFFGCDQEWFKSHWQRLSGCGPSVASNLLLYLHRAKCISLPVDVNNQSDCIKLMEVVWSHVTPTLKGIYMLQQFYNGVHSFTQAHGYSLEGFSLDIPKKNTERPVLSAIVDFIAEGLLHDCPVAFLNLSNGMVSNLDKWHWVTIVALKTDQNNSYVFAKVYDAAESIIIDLKLWYETTSLGGGFVFFKKTVDDLHNIETKGI